MNTGNTQYTGKTFNELKFLRISQKSGINDKHGPMVLWTRESGLWCLSPRMGQKLVVLKYSIYILSFVDISKHFPWKFPTFEILDHISRSILPYFSYFLLKKPILVICVGLGGGGGGRGGGVGVGVYIV